MYINVEENAGLGGGYGSPERCSGQKKIRGSEEEGEGCSKNEEE